jgi:hypothetical protein
MKIILDFCSVCGYYIIKSNNERDNKMTKSYRFNNKSIVMSDWGHAMFSDSAENVEGYGEVCWTVDVDKLTTIEEMEILIREAIEYCLENGTLNAGMEDSIKYYGIEETVASFFPDNIVDSAEAYDNGDLNAWLWDQVCEPNGIDGFKTPDGAIVYEPSLIELDEDYFNNYEV